MATRLATDVIGYFHPRSFARPSEFSMKRSDGPADYRRAYEVSGEDEDGNVHSFHTDCSEQASDIAALFKEDLSNVQVQNRLC